jgi:hypothetical protein
MTEKFNGEYKKTGSVEVSDADQELVRKADEKMRALDDALDEPEDNDNKKKAVKGN